MRRWLRSSEAARLLGLNPSTFRNSIYRGELAQVLHKKVGTETRWCAEALWAWHLQGHDAGCWDLDDIREFVKRYPLPAEL